MTNNIYNIADRLKQAGNVTFTKSELGRIIAIYSNHVAKGIWRDYALDCNSNMAVFSIFRSSQDKPIFTIIKSIEKKQKTTYKLYEHGNNIKQGETLDDILEFFKG